MKILFVVQNYYPSVGGTQIFFQNLAERCVADYGDEVTVFTTNSNYSPDKKQFTKIEPANEVINHVKVYRFSFYRFHLPLFKLIMRVSKKLFNKAPGIIFRYIVGPWSPLLMRAIKKTDADVIFAGTSNYLYMRYPLYRNELSNPKPFAFQGAFHFSENKLHVTSSVLNSIKASDYFLANTEYEKEKLVELGVNAEKIVTGGSSIDMELFENGNENNLREKLKITSNDILVGYIGRIESTKSIDVLLKAFDECCKLNKNIYLVIAGYENPQYSGQLKLIREKCSVAAQEHMHFLFNISVEEKINAYHALDIFVLPSVNESFGMVFLEAWDCKKPVVGAAIGAIKSVVTDGEDGVLAQPGNENDLAEKILLLANDKLKRESMGLSGYNKTKENYTWQIVTKKYRDTFIKAKNTFNVQGRISVD